jgi:ABC-type nitrate/sulfonate/bicarbonate transport system ATPase subunit
MTADGSAPRGISIQGVHKVFRRRGSADSGTTTFRALDDVTLEIGPREFVSVIGPSGCGKTTLLRMIAGLTRSDAGSIQVDGREVRGPGQERAMVFQNAALLPWADVTTNVAIGLKLRGIGRDERSRRAQDAIDLVALTGFERSLPRELSGGMQQRVGLARALVVDPAYLLMDEPFGSLDEITRRGMQAHLLKLWSTQEKGAVFVTHSVDEAIILSDRIVVMSPRPGKIVADMPVPLPTPRTHALESTPEFVAIRSQVWSALGGSNPAAGRMVGEAASQHSDSAA